MATKKAGTKADAMQIIRDVYPKAASIMGADDEQVLARLVEASQEEPHQTPIGADCNELTLSKYSVHFHVAGNYAFGWFHDGHQWVAEVEPLSGFEAFSEESRMFSRLREAGFDVMTAEERKEVFKDEAELPF